MRNRVAYILAGVSGLCTAGPAPAQDSPGWVNPSFPGVIRVQYSPQVTPGYQGQYSPPLAPNAQGQYPAQPAPEPLRTVEDLLNELTRVKAGKVELERSYRNGLAQMEQREAKIVEEVQRRLNDQSQRLQQLGFGGTPPAVARPMPATTMPAPAVPALNVTPIPRPE